MMTLAALFIFGGQVSAATWQVLYSYRWWNGTYLTSAVLTPDGTDVPYVIQEGGANDDFDVRVTAPATNTGGNLREFFWPASTPDVMDAQTCAVWSKQSEGFIQQGAALRIVNSPEGTRGISVTKNIFYAASWVFNVHVWDTSNTSKPYTLIGQFDMSEVMGKMYYDESGNFQSNLKPFPWRVCARAVGDQFSFKVWTASATPAWEDPKYTRTVTIPEGWNQPGKTGWYIGHVRPGQTAEFKNIHTHALR